MKHSLFNDHHKNRDLDVSTVENALVDLLVRANDDHISKLNLVKGAMRLVSPEEQRAVLSQVGSLKPEVEVGGSAANVLRALALLGGKGSYSSVVGHDEYGKSFAARLESLTIKNRLVYQAGPTGTCVVLVTDDGERTLNTHLGVCTSYKEEHLPHDDIASSKVFFTTGYAWDTKNQKDALRKAIRHATESGTIVALDVADAFVIERSGDELRAVIEESVDIVFANAVEAKMLVGATGEEGAKRLGQRVALAVVKDGPGGSYIAYGGSVLHVAAPQVAVVDTTGAGDFYAGGFLYGLTQHLPLDVCGAIATLMGSDTVQHLGVRHSSDVVERVRELLAHS
jgi:sugar/nucleoside kinase (ribokinase family)